MPSPAQYPDKEIFHTVAARISMSAHRTLSIFQIAANNQCNRPTIVSMQCIILRQSRDSD